MTNPAPRAVVSEAEIEELRKLAEAVHNKSKWYTPHELNRYRAMDDEDCAFIAALNPATVLRIVARLQAAEALLREARDSRAPDYADAEHPGWARRAHAFLSTGKPSK